MIQWRQLDRFPVGGKTAFLLFILAAYSWDFVIKIGTARQSLLFDITLGDSSTTTEPDSQDTEQQQGIYRLIPDKPDPLPRVLLRKAFESTDPSDPFEDNDVSLRIKQCPVTSQLRFFEAGWRFETLTETGKIKTTGGDEYYIVYEDRAMISDEKTTNSITAVASWQDHQNGIYTLGDFVTSPYLSSNLTLEGTGRLVVYLIHTCGVGQVGRPHKDKWATGGGVNAKWILSNVTSPPLTKFQPPESVDLGKYPRILGVGDSVMQHFVSSTYLKFFFPNLKFGRNMQNPLQMRTVDAFLNKIDGRLRPWINDNGPIALLIGSSSWDLLKPFGNEDVPIAGVPNEEKALFDDHIQASKKLISTVRRDFPVVDIYWRSGSAMHLHALRDGFGENWTWTTLDRVKYLSQYRVERLFHLQREMAMEMNVTFLDLYHNSNLLADHHRTPGDSMHYDIPTNQMMISWFYPNGFDETSTEA